MFAPIYAVLRAAPAVAAFLGADPARVYTHGEAPAAPVAPYAVAATVGDEPALNLGPTTIDRVIVQLDLYHTTGVGIEQLAKAVRDAMEAAGHVMTGVVADEREKTEPRHYRVALQFDCWV